MESWKSGFAIRKSPSSTCGKPTVLMPTEQQNTFTMRLPIRLNEKRLSQFGERAGVRVASSGHPRPPQFGPTPHQYFPSLHSPRSVILDSRTKLKKLTS